MCTFAACYAGLILDGGMYFYGLRTFLARRALEERALKINYCVLVSHPFYHNIKKSQPWLFITGKRL